jgi:hypothetical protein
MFLFLLVIKKLVTKNSKNGECAGNSNRGKSHLTVNVTLFNISGYNYCNVNVNLNMKEM